MKAIVCDRWGEPADVLQVREVFPPKCDSGQVRVRMIASPINPSDLFTIRGVYGFQPPLPCTPGFEGVGVVEEGRGLLAWRVMGKRVAVLNGHGGNWAEQVVIPARAAVPVPDSLSDEQAAMFFVNPASAIAMTRHVLKIPPGAWLLQTAAGSALGRMVIRLGQKHGFRTINVVRRAEQVEELKRAGGTEVVVSNENFSARIKEITGGEGVAYAIDAVGGDTAGECIKALGRGGRLLLYSSLSGEPVRFDPRALMVGHKRVEGFWLSEWVKTQGVLSMLALFRQIKRLMREQITNSEVAASYPMERIAEAVRHADTAGRTGKVLLTIGKR